MDIRLDGKRALVTGGNTGIGKAISLALAAAGASVTINYISQPDAAEEIAARIRDDGGNALTIETDVTDTAEVEDMFTQIDDAWGGIDILVNNAGIDGVRKKGWEIDLESWHTVLEVNLFGAFHCCRAALQRMVPQEEGVILNMTSVHEVIPWSGYSAYATSKAGLSMLSKTLAQEASPHGVRVLSLAPGAVKTPINEDVWKDPESRADLIGKIPMKRIGEPEDIAKMAVVLVSDAAGYVSGPTVFVDGGMTMYPDFSEGG